jgi:hypothetical protein
MWNSVTWVDVLTDGQSAYPPWCRAPLWGPWPDFSSSFLLPDNCFALHLGAPSLTRGRVYNLLCALSVVRVAEDAQPYITVSSETVMCHDKSGNRGNGFVGHLQHVPTSKDYALTVLHASQIITGHARSLQPVTVFISLCLVAAFNSGWSPRSWFLNCPCASAASF